MYRSLKPFSLFAFALTAACTNEHPAGPQFDGSIRANNATATAVSRTAGGRCTTDVQVVPPFVVIPTQPILNLAMTGVCTLRHLGHTTMVITQTVNVFTVEIINTTTYTAANGDQVTTLFEGTGVLGPITTFQGTETYLSGTGRFAAVSGSSYLEGTSSGGRGEYTTTGTIKY